MRACSFCWSRRSFRGAALLVCALLSQISLRLYAVRVFILEVRAAASPSFSLGRKFVPGLMMGFRMVAVLSVVEDLALARRPGRGRRGGHRGARFQRGSLLLARLRPHLLRRLPRELRRRWREEEGARSAARGCCAEGWWRSRPPARGRTLPGLWLAVRLRRPYPGPLIRGCYAEWHGSRGSIVRDRPSWYAIAIYCSALLGLDLLPWLWNAAGVEELEFIFYA
ncbi:hypothetical protein EJB05_49525, partial [Eragrostis curvula]